MPRPLPVLAYLGLTVSGSVLAWLGLRYLGVAPGAAEPSANELAPIDAAGHVMRADAAAAFTAMREAAQTVGIDITVASAFRSYAQQARLYAGFISRPCEILGVRTGLPGCFNLASPPGGQSGHEKGTSVDINVGSESSAVFVWLTANAPRFDFRNTGLTFKQREPWHWDWVG